LQFGDFARHLFKAAPAQVASGEVDAADQAACGQLADLVEIAVADDEMLPDGLRRRAGGEHRLALQAVVDLAPDGEQYDRQQHRPAERRQETPPAQ